jgi:hypothetical protein
MGKLRKIATSGKTASKLEYYVWNTIFGAGLFFLWYWLFLINTPPDGWQLLWLWIDSYTTGIVASIIARYLAAYGRFKWSGRFLMRNFLISWLYAFEVWAGLIWLMFGDFELWRVGIVFLLFKALNFCIAEVIAYLISNKISKYIMG